MTQERLQMKPVRKPVLDFTSCLISHSHWSTRTFCEPRGSGPDFCGPRFLVGVTDVVSISSSPSLR
jgi:hypothetical protein